MDEKTQKKIEDLLRKDPKSYRAADWVFLNDNFKELSEDERKYVSESYKALTPEEKRALTQKQKEPAVESEMDDIKFGTNLALHVEKIESNKKNMKTVRGLAAFGATALVLGGSVWGAPLGLVYGLKKEWDHRDEEIGKGRSKAGVVIDLLQYTLAGASVPLLLNIATGGSSVPAIGSALVLAGLNMVTGKWLDDKRAKKEIDREKRMHERDRVRSKTKQPSEYEVSSEAIRLKRMGGKDGQNPPETGQPPVQPKTGGRE